MLLWLIQTVNSSVLAVSEGLPGQRALLMGILNIFASPSALTEVLEERRQRERRVRMYS